MINIGRLRIQQIHGIANALEPGRVRGITSPLLASGRTDAGEKVNVYLKVSQPAGAAATLRAGPHWLARELICSALLSNLGVSVPEPYIATLDPFLISAFGSNPLVASVASISPAVHFATRRMEGFSDVQPNQNFTHDVHVGACASIYFADHLILNADRTAIKPNLLWNAHQVVAIDHGLAFNALETGWRGVGLPTNVSTQHAAWKTLRRYRPDMSKVPSAWVKAISAAVLGEISLAVPNEWKHGMPHVTEIIAYLCEHDKRLDALNKTVAASLG